MIPGREDFRIILAFIPVCESVLCHDQYSSEIGVDPHFGMQYFFFQIVLHNALQQRFLPLQHFRQLIILLLKLHLIMIKLCDIRRLVLHDRSGFQYQRPALELPHLPILQAAQNLLYLLIAIACCVSLRTGVYAGDL